MNVSNSHQRTFELLLQPNEFYDYCHIDVHVIVYVIKWTTWEKWIIFVRFTFKWQKNGQQMEINVLFVL